MTVRAEMIQFCLQHGGAHFVIGHSRGLVRSESCEVVLGLNNAERAFSKGDDCVFFLFLSFSPRVHVCIRTKTKIQPSVQLLKALNCFDFTLHTLPVKAKEEEREEGGVVGEGEGGWC